IATCTAMDVVEILRKKRQVITAYEVIMSGERATEHPRRFLSLEFVHRLTGRGIPRQAAEEAVKLAHEKYCSGSAPLKPGVPARPSLEIREGGVPNIVGCARGHERACARFAPSGPRPPPERGRAPAVEKGSRPCRTFASRRTASAK